MATNSDGSIILSVNIDTEGLQGELKKLNDTLQKGVKGFGNLGNTVNNFNNTSNTTNNTLNQLNQRITLVNQNVINTTTNITRLSSSVVNNNTQINTFGNATRRCTNALLNFGRQLGLAFSVAQIARFTNEASKLASQTESYLKRLFQIYGEASNQVNKFVEANSRALGMSKTAAYEAASSYGNLFSSFADGAENARLTNEMLQTTAVIASKTGRTFDEVFQKIQSGIFGNTRAIDDLGVYVNQATITTTQAFQTISDGRPWAQLTGNEQKQVLTLAILEQAQVKYGNTVLQSTALTRSQFNAAFQDFKSTWGAVINNVLMPVLRVITMILNAFTSFLSGIAKLTGKTVDYKKTTSKISVDTGKIGSNTGKINSNTGKTAKNQKNLNKELKKTLAGFDELEILSSKTSENTGDTGGATTGGGIDAGEVSSPEITEGNEGDMPPYVQTWQATLSSLMLLVEGGLIAIGLICLFHGNIGFGIAFIAAGASLLAIHEFAIQAVDFSMIGQTLTTLVAVTGIVMLTIGIILCWLGCIPWGIGFIVFGGGLLTIAAWEMFQNMNIDQMLSTLSGIMGFAAGVLLAIGLLLLWLGSVAWGIGFIIAGAVALTVSMVALSKMETRDIQGWLKTIFLIASGALLALGIILIFLAGPTPLSVGLIAAGAVGLATVVALDMTKVKNDVAKFFEDNKALIIGVAAAMLVIGIILCCVGVSIPLAIPLILAGGGLLATELALNWDEFKDKISTFVDGLLEFLKVAAKFVIGVMLCASGVGLPFGLALILSGIGDVIEKAEEIDWDYVKTKVGEAFDKVKEWVKTWGLLVLGIILCFTGVGIPLGMGLIKKAADNFADKEDPLWDTILTKVKDAWEKVKTFWKDHVQKYFTAEWWKELAVNCIKSFCNWIISGLNKLIRKINSLGFDLPDILGGGHIGFNIPQIPLLAKGAVLPANKPFLAVVGDQKSGTNIEAPAKLIKQMAMEAILESNLNNQGQTVREEHYYLDQTELMSVLYKLVKGGERITGESLID